MAEVHCPTCGGPAEEDVVEVDIGVGVQKHVTGYVCQRCGEIPVCSGCGGINGEHRSWCECLKDPALKSGQSFGPG